MPRFHNIDGNRIPFTAAEETARDAEELDAIAIQEAVRQTRSERQVLADRVASDDATLIDVLAYLRG